MDTVPRIQIYGLGHLSTIHKVDIVRSVTSQCQTLYPWVRYIYRQVVLDILIFIMVRTCQIRTGYCRVVTTFDSRTRLSCRPPCRLVRAGTTCCREDVTSTLCRILGIFQTSGCPQLEVYILAGLDIQVGTQAVLVITVCRISIQTIFAISSKIHIILHFFSTTGNPHVCTIQRRCTFYNFMEPIRINVFPWIGMSAVTLQLFFRERTREHFIQHRAILIRVRHLRNTGRLRETSTCVERDNRFTLFTAFGRNQDNTISSTRSVDSCRGIFQHGDGFNFCRIQTVHTTITVRNTINYNQRIIAT